MAMQICVRRLSLRDLRIAEVSQLDLALEDRLFPPRTWRGSCLETSMTRLSLVATALSPTAALWHTAPVECAKL
jgi:hypothetical protein